MISKAIWHFKNCPFCLLPDEERVSEKLAALSDFHFPSLLGQNSLSQPAHIRRTAATAQHLWERSSSWLVPAIRLVLFCPTSQGPGQTYMHPLKAVLCTFLKHIIWQCVFSPNRIFGGICSFHRNLPYHIYLISEIREASSSLGLRARTHPRLTRADLQAAQGMAEKEAVRAVTRWNRGVPQYHSKGGR